MPKEHVFASQRNIQLVTRRPDFEFKPEEIRRFYYRGSPVLTHIFNAFNVQAAPIETFFLKDGKYALAENLIKNPVLRRNVEEYIRQEAMHGAMHNKFNELLRARGYPVDWAQQIVWDRLAKLDRKDKRMLRVAMGVAGEHVLGEIGELVLNHPTFTDGLDPAFKALAQWHFYEEIEHKSVAIDAYHEVFGRNWRSYLTRIRALWTLFQVLVPSGLQIRLAFRKVDGIKMRRKEWLEVLRFLFVDPAFLLRIARAVLAFLDPRFHPCTYRDNFHYLDRYRSIAIRDDWVVASRPDRSPPDRGDSRSSARSTL